MNEKKQNKGALLVAGILAILLVVCVVLLVVKLSGRIQDKAEDWKEQKQTEQDEDARKEEDKKDAKKDDKKEEVNKEEAPTATAIPAKGIFRDPDSTPTPVPTVPPTEVPGMPADENYELKRVNYSVVLKLNDNAFIAWANNQYGLANAKGEYLVEPQYTYVEYYDDEWVSFSNDDNKGYVYDTTGKQLYTYDCWVEGLTTEDGIAYGIWTCYKKGMRVEMIVATSDADYFGAKYFNAETGELIFEAVGSYAEVALTTIPDETGAAVVVQNGDREIIIHRVTKDGYTTDSRWYFDVAIRHFFDSDYMSWREQVVSEGWLRTTFGESNNAEDGYTTWVQSLFDTQKFVMMPLPDKYQNTYADFYGSGKGAYYGISTLTEEEYYGEYPETMYYAICYRNSVLTEEIYTWLAFDTNYILAGTDDFAHILDYEGNVLKEYKDMASAFVNGKLMVSDGHDVFMIDENLEICSGSLATDVDYIMPGFVWKGRAGYIILE